MTPRSAADLIADKIFTWTRQVLSIEDREQIAEVIESVTDPKESALAKILPEPSCSFCQNTSRWHDKIACRDRWIAEVRSLKQSAREAR